VLVQFFFQLRAAGIPVSITEFLALLAALEARVAGVSAQDFYFLARACLVKDERHYDRFDRVFAQVFEGAEQLFAQLAAEVPAEWLERLTARVLPEEERRRIQALGGWERLLETLRERLREQRSRHAGGNRWIGTGGTSPFGVDGYNPEGIRIGSRRAGERRAVKVWERHNAVKVLLFLDVGGSMDGHVRLCEELFSAARSEFKHLEYFYFHNCLYESVWRDNARRFEALIPTARVLRTYGRDYRVILVGDATMSPYEIVQPGGSIEHWNEESGAVWMQRLCAAFPRLVWLNPEDPARWAYTPSTRIMRELMQERMFPLSLAGLDLAISELRRPLSGTAIAPGGTGATLVTQGPPSGVP